MQILLRDVNPAVCAAWRVAFANAEGVTVEEGDIFSTPVDAVVSPANSFGHMDGGIDLVYRDRMGAQIEETVKVAIGTRFEFGELLVGDAISVTTMWEPLSGQKQREVAKVTASGATSGSATGSRMPCSPCPFGTWARCCTGG